MVTSEETQEESPNSDKPDDDHNKHVNNCDTNVTTPSDNQTQQQQQLLISDNNLMIIDDGGDDNKACDQLLLDEESVNDDVVSRVDDGIVKVTGEDNIPVVEVSTECDAEDGKDGVMGKDAFGENAGRAECKPLNANSNGIIKSSLKISKSGDYVFQN